MTPQEFQAAMDYKDKSPQTRKMLAQTLLDHPILLATCFTIIAQQTPRAESRAAMLLEMVCKKKLKIIIPHLDEYFEVLPHLKGAGAIRSLAKIGELIILSNYMAHGEISLSRKQIDILRDCAFEWLITEQKTAPQAHAMYILFWIGITQPWIHEELKAIIIKNMPHGSAGYIARGRNTLKGIESYNKSKNMGKI